MEKDIIKVHIVETDQLLCLNPNYVVSFYRTEHHYYKDGEQKTILVTAVQLATSLGGNYVYITETVDELFDMIK